MNPISKTLNNINGFLFYNVCIVVQVHYKSHNMDVEQNIISKTFAHIAPGLIANISCEYLQIDTYRDDSLVLGSNNVACDGGRVRTVVTCNAILSPSTNSPLPALSHSQSVPLRSAPPSIPTLQASWKHSSQFNCSPFVNMCVKMFQGSSLV